MDVTFWETEPFYSPSAPSLQGEHRQEEMREVYSHGQGEELFFNHGEGEKEKSEEEPVSTERATYDIGGDIENRSQRWQMLDLEVYTRTRRKNGKLSCVMPLCQSQLPAPVLDSSADSSELTGCTGDT
ncbi:uncharacterized protein LOC131325264 [Rhododendron vialii]|uniref:uncharacterized protein LOC131325264 n=1 Tax=Rhododendron vialii TaxID=182163 RepID=UPI00265D7318|nr:uncharacterized protein LOC131325264 [Rhododendron vialii]